MTNPLSYPIQPDVPTVLIVAPAKAMDHDFWKAQLQPPHESLPTIAFDWVASRDEALAKMTEKIYPVVLSSVDFPEEDGFAVLSALKKVNPHLQGVLLVPGSVDSLMLQARASEVWNLMGYAPKKPMPPGEIYGVLWGLMFSENTTLFPYLKSDAGVETETLTDSEQIKGLLDNIRQFYQGVPVKNMDNLLTAVMEALANALYHAVITREGDLKYKQGVPIQKMDQQESVAVSYGKDAHGVAIAVTDYQGRITPDEVLYWLERQTKDEGLLDTHGRGVFLMYHLVDRLLIKIYPGQKTQVILRDYFDPAFSLLPKPLYIHQFE